MKVSIFDVAKKSGLSVVTVSRVLNNSASVRQKNRDKVLQAMKELDYQPNAAARSLARGKTGVIGLTLTTLHDAFLDAVVQELNDRLAKRGYFLALSVTSGDDDSFRRSLFQEDRVDGVILLSPLREDDYVMELKKKKIPFVMLDNQHRNGSVPTVIVDNFKGGYEATRHLIGLGHRRIAHIGGPEPFLSSRERERGYVSAMKDAGLEPLPVRRAPFAISSGYESARVWIERGKLPTAVFAADDYQALGVMNALMKEGIRIPDDVSIVGYDDQIFASEFRPALTTVRQPAEQMGRTGVEMLMHIIHGDTSKPNAGVMLEPELLIRESTAPLHHPVGER